MAETHWQKAKHKHVNANPTCPCSRCQKGWYSRRHETRAAQDAARERYQATRGKEARKRRAIIRELGEKPIIESGEALEKLA